MPEVRTFSYVALDDAGQRVAGRTQAASLQLAHADLKAKGLSPTKLAPASSSASRMFLSQGLSDRDAAEFAADLSSLLRAGADMRTALDMLAERPDNRTVRRLAESLVQEISGGSGVGAALAKHMGRHHGFISSLVTAGESGGGISAGLQRASEMLEARVKLRDQLVSALSYPAFVLLTTVLALGAILLFVIPALAPLVDEAGGSAPFFLRAMIAVSTFLIANLAIVATAALLSCLAGVAAARSEAGSAWLQGLFLDRLSPRTAGGLVFGGFAVTLGSLLTGGSSMSDALKLSIEAVGQKLVRERLNQAELRVRQGERLSEALAAIKGFPSSISRLAKVGEASGSLGEMLARAGRLEEEKAIRRLESGSRSLGPALIVLLGGVVGLLMAGLLSGVSQLGSAAIQ